MRYWMYDTRGRGDAGGMSMALWEGEPTKDFPEGLHYEHNSRPRVGVAMRVGSVFARTMQAQDWWQTTLITEIVKDTPDEVVFKTKNSTYTWKII